MREKLYDDKLTIRLTPHSKLKLLELNQSLNISTSLLIRAIINRFIDKNEDLLNEIIDSKKKELLSEIFDLNNKTKD
jgi:predicted DNA-binding protein